MKTKAEVTVTSLVRVPPADAFAIFTGEIDAWWRRGPAYRFSLGKRGTLRFEPGVGGRLVEIYDEQAGDLWEIGRVLAWEPGARLAFEWRTPAYAPGERTEVTVRFEPVTEGTRVTIEHRGLSALPAGHRARHGLVDAAFAAMVGRWWGALAIALREHAQRLE